jgi:excisionase family DNA binding protein
VGVPELGATVTVRHPATITVEIVLNGARVPVVLDTDALAAIAHAIDSTRDPEPESEYLTIPEAAELLRCKRQRIYDLLSQRRIPRVKDGTRTLLRRSDLDAYLADGKARRTRWTST